MPNIYQNISQNKQDTIAIMILFVSFISFIAWFIGEYLIGGEGYSLTILAFIFSGVSAVSSYYYSDKLVLSISGAKEADKKEYHDLYNLVENMSIASGIPMPKVYIIDDTAMNAFATGRDPEHGVICFTSGIVSYLNKRELEGVVAHEMSHIGNYDIRLMTIISVLVGTVTLLIDWLTRGVFYGRGRSRNSRDSDINTLMFVIGIILIILSPIIASLIKLAISRRREFLADSTAAYITRYPRGLANALRKLDADREILEAANGATAHLYITNPLKNSAHEGTFVSNLFSTHPPIKERIKRLEEM